MLIALLSPFACKKRRTFMERNHITVLGSAFRALAIHSSALASTIKSVSLTVPNYNGQPHGLNVADSVYPVCPASRAPVLSETESCPSQRLRLERQWWFAYFSSQ